MSKFDTSMGGSNRVFPTTLWTLVLDAGRTESASRLESLETLVEQYWRPAYLYIKALRRKGVDDAKDLTQAFFTRLLDKNSLERIDPERGTFRGFLKEAIRNFLIDARRRESARRPPAGKLLLQIEEFRDKDDGIQDRHDPDAIFEREWNQIVLFTSLAKLETRMKKEGLKETFEVFRRYCLPENKDAGAPSDSGRTYQDIARELDLTEASVRKRLSTCREKLREIMRETIRNYVVSEEEAQQEYRNILGES